MKRKTILVAGILLLLACGIVYVILKQIQSHRLKIWQKRMDTSVLDDTPRQAKIVPTLGTRPQNASGWTGYHGMYLGWNVGLPEIARIAYGVPRPRLLFAAPVPDGNYDFICNVAKNQNEALKDEIKKEFGLVGRRVSIVTNVFILTSANSKSPGLKPFASPGITRYRTNGFTIVSNFPVDAIAPTFEYKLGTPVVDKSGMRGCCDVKWDGSTDSLKQNVLTNLGLELISGRDKVEFVMMEKTN